MEAIVESKHTADFHKKKEKVTWIDRSQVEHMEVWILNAQATAKLRGIRQLLTETKKYVAAEMNYIYICHNHRSACPS